MSNQCDRLLAYLRRHGEIDPLTSWRSLGIYRLGTRIYDLKRRGYNIKSDRVTVRNRFGEGVRVANYKYLEPDFFLGNA